MKDPSASDRMSFGGKLLLSILRPLTGGPPAETTDEKDGPPPDESPESGEESGESGESGPP